MLTIICVFGLVLVVIGIILLFKDKCKQGFMVMFIANALGCGVLLADGNMGGALVNGVVALLCIWMWKKY